MKPWNPKQRSSEILRDLKTGDTKIYVFDDRRRFEVGTGDDYDIDEFGGDGQ